MNNLKPINNIETAIKIALTFIVIYICFLIFKPFLFLVIWAIIIAVAIYPLHLRLMKLLKNKGKISAILLSSILLAIIIIPASFFLSALADSTAELAMQFKSGQFSMPAPSETVANWPVIGKPIYEIWQLFYSNIEFALTEYKEQVAVVGKKLLSVLSGITGVLLMLIIAVIISGVFLINADSANKLAITVSNRLIGEKGGEIINNSKATIRSVVNGVLGTAIIQSFIISIGFFVAGVPGAPILSIFVLILAIVQLPPSVIALPVVIYMFTVLPTTGAVIFSIWNLI
jgi:predicted PurR-regulated permease PerM